MSVKLFLFKDPGIIRKAVDHLFYSIEETPDRYFLMQVSKRFRPDFIPDAVSVPDPEQSLVRHDYSASGRVTENRIRTTGTLAVRW